MDRILLWAVQSQGHWRFISIELSLARHRWWPPHPPQRSGGCNTIIEEREVSWSWQHLSRTGPSRLRGCNHCSHEYLQQDLAEPVDASLVITHPKKGNLQQCHKQSALIISHPSKVIAEDHTVQIEATSGEDHRWRTGRLQNRKEHHRADLQPKNPLWEISAAPAGPLHVFMDFKKAFDSDWHADLWATMKKYNISTNLIRVIKHLYDKATSAVLFNSSVGDWFWTTVGVRQGCLLSPTLFSTFLGRVMTDA